MRLNLIGRAAIAVLCLAGAGAGHAGSRLVDPPVELGLVGGVVAVLAGLLLLDHRRWARLNDRDAPER